MRKFDQVKKFILANAGTGSLTKVCQLAEYAFCCRTHVQRFDWGCRVSIYRLSVCGNATDVMGRFDVDTQGREMREPVRQGWLDAVLYNFLEQCT